MRIQLLKIGFAGIFLLITTFISVVFTCWLVVENDDDRVHQILVEHDRLLLMGRRQEARELLIESLRATGEGPLDLIWLPVAQAARGNGYEQLEYHERFLAANPDREDTYKAISNLINMAPKVFHDQVKHLYFESISRIPGIRRDLLAKYELLPVRNE